MFYSGNRKISKRQKPVPLMWKLCQKTVYVLSRYKFRYVSSVYDEFFGC